MIAQYYQLTKPGIIRGNLITAAAGFLFASKGSVDFSLMAAALGGIVCLIASACVFNNIIDREIDSKMARTKKRAIPSGEIPILNAQVFGLILGLAALFLLSIFVNWLTVLLGLIAFVDYVFLYGWAKRRSVHSTLVGTIAGAMPITAGYVAVVNLLDQAGLLLFLILVFWQMPHFYSIGIYRAKEYKAAKIPILPLVFGNQITKKQIILYTGGFVCLTSLLNSLGHAGTVYLLVIIISGIWWLWQGLKGLSVKNDIVWAKRMFGHSLVVLLIFSVLLSFDNLLP